MNLEIISVVATFLLSSVIAERNGPTNFLGSRRSIRRIVNMENGNRNNARRSRSSDDQLKVIGISRISRTSQGKFPRTMTGKNSFITTGEATRNQRPKIFRGSRRSSARKIDQSRRSSDLNIDSNHFLIPKINDDEIFLEPIPRDKSENNFFSHLFEKVFNHDSKNHIKYQGPSIGPLNIPGIGENVYIRLPGPPEKEIASHVTLHVFKTEPIEIFSDIDESVDFLHLEKPKPLFFSGQKSAVKTSPLIQPNQFTHGSNPENSGRGRFISESVQDFGFTPSKAESLEFLTIPNFPKSSQEMRNSQLPESELENPALREYSAAPNHHQLPIVHRSEADNLIDLPIYPPLDSGDEFEDGDKTGIVSNAESRIKTFHNLDDAQQSASSKHISVSRNYSTSPNARKPIGVILDSPEAKFTSKIKEAGPVLMAEIKAPDLGSDANILSMTESPSWNRSKKANISIDDDEYGSEKLRGESSGSPRIPEEDEHGVRPNSVFSLRQTSTTSRTNDVSFSLQDHNSDRRLIKSTTLNYTLKIESRRKLALEKMKK